MITEILPRLSKLSRPATVPGKRVFEQVIVSNADMVIPVFASASPPPKWGLLDRYLVTAEAAKLPVLIVITKLDLANGNHKLDDDLETYHRIGYPIHKVSSVTARVDLDELKQILQGKMSVLIGKSGVGKTSLVYRFIENRFSTDFKSTLGVNLLKRQVEIDGNKVTVQIWDLGGQEAYPRG